jgi:hypothetical protein
MLTIQTAVDIKFVRNSKHESAWLELSCQTVTLIALHRQAIRESPLQGNESEMIRFTSSIQMSSFTLTWNVLFLVPNGKVRPIAELDKKEQAAYVDIYN